MSPGRLARAKIVTVAGLVLLRIALTLTGERSAHGIPGTDVVLNRSHVPAVKA